MKSAYEAWLRAQGYEEGTITAQLHRVGRVEQYLGDLDAHHATDGMEQVLDWLRYSADDERFGRPNPTAIPINGKLRTNLASYRNAVGLYRKFCDGGEIERRLAPLPVDRMPRMSKQEGRAAIPPEHARTLAEFGFDGQAALAALIATSRYGTIAQAVASLAAFSHPDTVAQTAGRGIFPTIRGVPGRYTEVEGRRLMMDDNKSPTDAFLWSNGLGRRGRDTQFNHVYAASGDVEAYTALPNIVMTPAFLAKLTDTNAEVRSLLAWRSYDLYGWKPGSSEIPARPDGYGALEWAAPLPPVRDLHARLEHVMARRQKDRTVLAARSLGWLFGEVAEHAR